MANQISSSGLGGLNSISNTGLNTLYVDQIFIDGFTPVVSLVATSPLTLTTISPGFLSLGIPQSSSITDGYLSFIDFTSFNNRVLTVSAPLVKTGTNVTIPAATTLVSGYLTSTDWTTFNNKVGTATTPLVKTGINLAILPSFLSLLQDAIYTRSISITYTMNSTINTLTSRAAYAIPADYCIDIHGLPDAVNYSTPGRFLTSFRCDGIPILNRIGYVLDYLPGSTPISLRYGTATETNIAAPSSAFTNIPWVIQIPTSIFFGLGYNGVRYRRISTFTIGNASNPGIVNDDFALAHGQEAPLLASISDVTGNAQWQTCNQAPASVPANRPDGTQIVRVGPWTQCTNLNISGTSYAIIPILGKKNGVLFGYTNYYYIDGHGCYLYCRNNTVTPGLNKIFMWKHEVTVEFCFYVNPVS